MMGNPPRLNAQCHKLIDIKVVGQSDACAPHRSSTPARSVIVRYFIPIFAILAQYHDRFACGPAWSPSCHARPALLILYCKIRAYLFQTGIFLFNSFLLADKCLGSGNVHHCIITVPPSHIYIQCQWPFVVCQIHHLFVDYFCTCQELPVSIFIPHCIPHRCKHHASPIVFYFTVLILLFVHLQKIYIITLLLFMGGKTKKDKKKEAEEKRQQRRKQRDLLKKMRKKMNKGDIFKLTKQYMNYYQVFNQQMKALNLKLKDVGGDGNCLFRSMGDQLDGTQNTHMFLRQEACKYILNNAEFFKNFIDEDEQGTIEQYANGMRKNGEWGGHLELQALSECLKCIIVVHKKDMEEYYVTPMISAPNGSILHLAYFQHQDFQHYLSLRDLQDNSEDPAINKLKYINKNMYQHLIQLEDPQQMALRKQIQQLQLADNYENQNGDEQYYEEEQKKPIQPFPGFPPNKKCKCGSSETYKNCCLKNYHKKMASLGFF